MRRSSFLFATALAACTSLDSAPIDTRLLQGPWFTDGPSFTIVIGEDTILFELDMREHPYRLEGDTLVIEFDDGTQRKRILRVTPDLLEWEDLTFGHHVRFTRRNPAD